MSYAATSAAPAPGEVARLGSLLLLPIGILIVVQIVLISASGGFDLTSFGGPDSYMHLTRARALEHGAPWFDPREFRIGPPDGHVQHWTRPFDAILWAGARALAPLLGFADGLVVTGQLISPVILALSVVALDWAARPILARQTRFLACLLLLLQPAVLAYGGLGRADHHSLLLLLFLVMLGHVIRALDPGALRARRAAVLAGCTGAMALWISTESLVFIGAFMLATGVAWLSGALRLAAANRDLALAMTVMLGAALLVERGGNAPLAIEVDRISILHVVLFGLIAVFWSAMQRFAQGPVKGFAWRLGASGAGALVLAAAMVTLFPEVRNGVLGEVDPLYRELRLKRIFEIRSPVDPAWLASGETGLFFNRLLFWFGLALPAVPWLAHRLWHGGSAMRRRWLPVALGVAVTVPLTFYQWRWGIYAQAILVVPYAAALAALLERAARAASPSMAALVRAPMIVIGLFWTHAAAMALPGPAPVETASANCPVAALSEALNDLDRRPRTIMAMADFGSELLWRTHHAVLSMPNHRPQPGFRVTALSLANADPQRARTLMAEHGVDWVLLCGTTPEASFVASAAKHDATTLYDRLIGDEPPAGFRRIPLAGFENTRIRLHAVEP